MYNLVTEVNVKPTFCTKKAQSDSFENIITQGSIISSLDSLGEDSKATNKLVIGW